MLQNYSLIRVVKLGGHQEIVNFDQYFSIYWKWYEIGS